MLLVFFVLLLRNILKCDHPTNDNERILWVACPVPKVTVNPGLTKYHQAGILVRRLSLAAVYTRLCTYTCIPFL